MLAEKMLEASGNSASAANYVEDVFSTYLYTGNGSTQTITNGIDLSTKGGLVWIKDRNSGAKGHALFDTARGVNLKLQTQSTNGEFSGANQLTAFNATGFDLGSAGDPNGSGTTYASWTFRKQPKFFDVVTYTGDGNTSKTISHSLGSTPGCIIVKRTDTTGGWATYHRQLNGGTTPQNYYVYLNSTNAQTASSAMWNNTAPTSTQFTVGNDTYVNASGGTYVAYLFAHDAGGFGLTGTDNVISCGSWTGANTEVNLGWEPQWVLSKRSDSATVGAWELCDNMRGMPAAPGSENYLLANTSAAEVSGGYNFIQPTATGFKTNTVSTGTYIYIAIRRGPMKVPTDGTKVFYPLTRSGTASNTTITNPGFPVDWVFSRGSISRDGAVWDRLRGALLLLQTSSTAAEASAASSLTGFDLQNGVKVGVDNSYYEINDSTQTYVNYQLRRAPSFFDEVCYTGTGANQAYNHNLGIAPEMIIVKVRNAADAWLVATSITPSNFSSLRLQTTGSGSILTYSDGILSAAPTATTFSMGTDASFNGSAKTYVAYLFATCAGVSKVGSYTGNGSTQTINCGFAGGARFVLIKRTDSTGGWYVYDTARGMTTLTDPYLFLNSTAAEAATLGSVTTVTTGFAVNASILAAINTNGASYIYFSVA